MARESGKVGSWRRRGNRIELKAYAGRDPLSSKPLYEYRRIDDTTDRNADKAAAAFALEVGARRRPPSELSSSMLVGEMFDRYFEKRVRDWSPSNAGTHDRFFTRNMAPIRHLRVVDVTTWHLDELFSALRDRGGLRHGEPLSARSVDRIWDAVAPAFQQAVDWGIRPDNPALGAKPKETARKKKVTPPSDAQVVELLSHAAYAEPGLFAYLTLDVDTGARRGELAALRLNDRVGDRLTIERAIAIGPWHDSYAVRFEGRYWKCDAQDRGKKQVMVEMEVTKSGEKGDRTLILSPNTVAVLDAWEAHLHAEAAEAGIVLAPDAFLWPANADASRPLRPDTWGQRFRRLRDELGLRSVRLHDLRHWVATTLLVEGSDLATVAGRLGHAGGGRTTLGIYAHFLESADTKATSILTDVLDKARAEVGKRRGGAGGAVVDLSDRRRRRVG